MIELPVRLACGEKDRGLFRAQEWAVLVIEATGAAVIAWPFTDKTTFGRAEKALRVK